MKNILAVLAALAAVAAAVPGKPQGCQPATYGCAKNPQSGVDGWQVCDVTHQWVYAGDCPPNTHCHFLQANGSPYCIP
ncbi:hypothetical protein QBC33DRAFT_562729 [Phialemonium atrogriseum]|uniref:SSCRP protein n=1 Tax=Phialemonium atrogriseum TaxID=1093897 RepID=A0AAJ0BWZ9_9PEZI|nr:uncharacterized protein QBC33DRAFT_562729 [Phialemonium atrogriseum]KAK1763611.1 hypothetical protein QBC33DRAFT_562729 [Phialemonium atrogriseum]